MGSTNETTVGGNPFLTELLTLQQDGRQAISAPSNWLREPLLRVETDTIRRVRDFSEHVEAADVVQWLVLVGGPGNGKSMAVRELVTSLLDKGLTIQDEQGLPISEMAGRPVPAVLEVRNSSGRLLSRIAQDASVVPDPYVDNPNPARDLRSLMVRCAEDRCHLVACANRGVLEAAAAQKAGAAESPVDQILARTAEVGRQRGTAGEITHEFDGIKLTARPMDVGSLFEGSTPVFEQLLQEAMSEQRWASCKTCLAAEKCPFWANRRDLSEPEFRSRVLRLLEDAELLDGQPLVFREAGALVSLVLAGCAADYEHEHPCEWVARQVDVGGVFRLAARRLHMVLFSSSAPLGVEQEEEVLMLERVCNLAGIAPETIVHELPSTRVGLDRLLGKRGVMRELDPLSEPFERGLVKWEGGYPTGLGLNGLERACQEVWDALDAALQETDEDVTLELGALARWTSSHTLRFGALREGRYAWRIELDGFREAIGLAGQPGIGRRRQLTRLLREVLDSRAGVRVAANVRVDPSACGEIEVNWDESYARKSICISLGGSSEVLAQIPASIFIWLRRRHDAPLHDGTFPAVLLHAARDAIARAASARLYSRTAQGRMWVDRGDRRAYELLWGDGQVEAELGDE